MSGDADLTKSPDFQAALAAAVEAQMAGIKAQNEAFEQRMLAAVAQRVSGIPGADATMLSELAMHIAELTDQGSGRKRVAPEILAKRELAGKELVARLKKVKADDHKPVYRVMREVYLAERIIRPYRLDEATKQPVPVYIEFQGCPSDHLRPHNAVAKEVFDIFIRWIGHSTQSVPKSDLRDLAMTPKGVVVRGLGASAHRTIEHQVEHVADEYEEVLRTGNTPVDPTAEEVRVLGTIMEPARQNFTKAA